ncbi:zf-HC2 domain-containing protein [Streptomyces sp. NPDC002133]|uniref:zf-HC2 domain-containing protein n=1 Tax=Streptomyces sp. NPDC002133 TaxID=3154409 RepID=UPI003329E794
MTAPDRARDWHVNDALAARYATGALPEPDAWSVEKHVESCGSCAGRVSAAVRATPAAALLDSVRTAVLAQAATAEADALDHRGQAGQHETAAAADGTILPVGEKPEKPRGPLRPTGPARPARTGAPGTDGDAARRRTWAAALAARRIRDLPVLPARGRRGSSAPSAAHHGTESRPREARRRTRLAAMPDAPGTGTSTATGLRRAVRSARAVARRMWAAGPALHEAWLVALGLVVVAAVGLGYGAGFAGTRPLLAAVAPVVPLAGVALSYGRRADPLHEIAASTPSGGLRLLLARTATVLTVSVPLLTVAGAVLPGRAGMPGAAAWLLPGLALTLAALALGSYVGCRAAAALVAVGWLSAAVGPALVTGRLLAAPAAELTARVGPYVSGAAVQSAWAVAAAVCAGLLALRRRAFDYPSFGHWGNL